MRFRVREFATIVALGLAALMPACGRAPASSAPHDDAPPPPAAVPTPPASKPAADFQIAFLGDSLTAGLGLSADEAYPAVIGRQFAAAGYHDIGIVNAGISGDTTADGLARVDDLLAARPRILVVALGGNDVLRGLDPTATHDNLEAIVTRAEAQHVAVFLAGMLAPANLGPDYQRAFSGAFSSVAAERPPAGRPVTFVSFLLDGVAGVPSLNQADGIHPTAEGARRVAAHLYPALRALVDRVSHDRDGRHD